MHKVAALAAVITAAALSAHPAFAEPNNFSAAVLEHQAGPVPICYGDCNDDGAVTIDEIVQIVGQILGTEPARCTSIFPSVDVSGAVTAVNSALRDCQILSYRLTSGNTILSSLVPPGQPVVEEPLSGLFTVIPGYHSNVNALFYFVITSIQFQSASFALSGWTGGICAFPPSAGGMVHPLFTVSMGPLVLGLCGVSPDSVFSDGCPPAEPLCHYPPTFDALEVCAGTEAPTVCAFPRCDAIRDGSVGGYSLRISAVPDAAP